MVDCLPSCCVSGWEGGERQPSGMVLGKKCILTAPGDGEIGAACLKRSMLQTTCEWLLGDIPKGN